MAQSSWRSLAGMAFSQDTIAIRHQQAHTAVSMTTRTLAPLLTAVLLATGCATTPDGQRNIAPTIKTAAYLGTAYALAERPEWRPGFTEARNDLALIEQAEQIDFVMVLAIVQRLPIKELSESKATILLTGAIILLGDYGRSLPPDQLDKLRPVVKAMREGIELGLGHPPAIMGSARLEAAP